MYAGSIPHDRIIATFQKHVPGTYVRDYRGSGGYITLAKGYRDIRWQNQGSGGPVERQVPAVTLVSIPQGNVTSATHFNGLRLTRPGWRLQFKKAASFLTLVQKHHITRDLGVGQVFPDVGV